MKRKNGEGTITKPGHIRLGSKDGSHEFEHRTVWIKHNGEIPEGLFIHHINGIKDDNRIENLQLVDPLTHARIHSGCVLVEGSWWKQCKSCRLYKEIDKDFYVYKKDVIKTFTDCKSCYVKRVMEYQKSLTTKPKSD